MKINIYALTPGQMGAQIDWPDGAKPGQPDAVTTRERLRQLLHSEIDRWFDAFAAMEEMRPGS